tara:strand:- start:536 stop:703 length:168 start_codon:yes stop_codon:yes gene_type:complete
VIKELYAVIVDGKVVYMTKNQYRAHKKKRKEQIKRCDKQMSLWDEQQQKESKDKI